MKNIKLYILAVIVSTSQLATAGCVSPDGDYPNSTDTLENEINEGECSGTHSAENIISTNNQILTQFNFQFNRPTSNISNALRYMRSATQSVTAEEPRLSTGGGSSADSYKIEGDTGVFFGAGGSFGVADSQSAGQEGSSKYKHYGRNANLAFDYRINNQIRSGLFFSYTSMASDIQVAAGNLGSNIFRFAPFLSFTPVENAFVDVSVGYGYHNNSAKRACAGCVDYLNADYDAHEVFGHIGGGYTYNIGSWDVTGYAQGSAISINIGGYNENGANSLQNGVTVSRLNPLSVATTLGSELTYTWNTSFGVLVPRVFGEWLHEYKNDSQIIQASTGLGTLTFVTPSPITDWANIGISTQLVLPNSISTFVGYKSLIMVGGTNHVVEGGIRWQF